jgi:hypothetical protein
MTRLARGRRLATWLAPALLMGTLTLAACGSSSTGTGGTGGNTPDAATILQKAKAVQINDETYTMSLSTTAAGQTNTLTVNGESTKNPQREQLDMTVSANGTNASYTLLEDTAGKADYVKFSNAGSLGLPTGKWIKMPTTSAQTLASGVDTLLNYSEVANPKLVGSEQLGGVAVWHLQATETLTATPTAGASGTGTADLYFRQDNYYPVKVTAKTAGTDAANATITWTAINSGITIAVPAASDVTTLPGA